MKKTLILVFSSLVAILSAQSQSFNPVGLKYDESNLALINGTIVTVDATADGGTAMIRTANTGGETMWFGPYSQLKAGNYIIQFRMKVVSAASAQNILTIDIIGTGVPSTYLAIAPNQFRANNEWQLFSLPVQIPANAANIEIRGLHFQPGITDLYLDYINILPGDLRGFYSNEFTITPNGSVGLGTTAPAHKLDVIGNISVSGDIKLGAGTGVVYSDVNAYAVFHDGNYLWQNRGNDATRMMLGSNGDLLVYGNQTIGTTASQKNLAVNGNIQTRKIKVTQTDWADYVFDSSYQLPSLSLVETFIKENKHLPEVPSATEVKKDGLDLGDNQSVLLKKIEELTLYIIQQSKKMEQVEKRLADMEAKSK